MSMRVLLVEDDDGIRTLATMALERVGGCTVTAVENGERAVEVAPGQAFDVLVIDMMMPGLDGVGTMQRLREKGVDAPVVFLTAKVHSDDIAAYREAGAAGTIKKPFDPMTLTEQVRRLVAGSDG